MLTDKKVSYDYLQAQQLLQPGDQQPAALNNRMDELTQRWKTVNDVAEAHQRKLTALSESSGDFNAHFERFINWLSGVETSLKSSEVGGTTELDLSQALHELEVCNFVSPSNSV